jgi:hypothetical protein
MLSDGALGGLALKARHLLHSLDEPVLAPFLADWPDHAWPNASASPPAARGSGVPEIELDCTLPALRWLADFSTEESAFGATLIADLCRNHPLLMWRQTYASGEVGDAFLRNYAYAEIVGAKSIPSARIACGFLILGPSTLYPRHRHEAEEIYVPLRGTAQWQQGDAVWRERLPGAVIHHASDEPHAVKTAEGPLLAMYVWRSEELNQKARLA